MEVILGKLAGFCPGVTNTVVKAEKYLDENEKTLYCLGQLIHNEQVVKRLERKGLKIVEDIDEVPDNIELVIRAHGTTKEIYETAEKRNIKLIDLTCPKVLKIHKQVEKYAENGYYIFLIAEKNHPETIGTHSFCGKNVSVIEEREDVEEAISKFVKTDIKNLTIVAQTTFSMEKFDKLVEKIKREVPKQINIEINKTICDATRTRQLETKDIAKQVDLMIIIGGKKSSNTNKLYEIAVQECNNAMLVQTKEDLYLNYIQRFKKVGVMAGASTPRYLIQEIAEILRNTENKGVIEGREW